MSPATLSPEVIRQKLYRFNRIHTPISSPAAVGESEIRAYHDQGFLAVENVFTPAEVANAKDALADLVMGRVKGFDNIEFESGIAIENLPLEQRERYVRKLMYFCKHDPRLHSMATNPNLLAIAEKLLQQKTTMIQDMALLKPPHVGREKPWHQDNAYFLWSPLELILGTWTALDPATPDNGCMHVIPGTHKLGPVAHYHDRDCQIADDQIDVDRDVMVPLQPGGTLFFYGLLHHGTPPNQSASRRRAVQLHYAGIHCKKMSPEDHAKIFTDNSGYAGCATWAFNPPAPKRPSTDRPAVYPPPI